MIREVVLASLEAMSRMTSKAGFLWKPGPIDPTDALFLEGFSLLGFAFRYGGTEVVKTCEAIAKKELSGGPSEVDGKWGGSGGAAGPKGRRRKGRGLGAGRAR